MVCFNKFRKGKIPKEFIPYLIKKGDVGEKHPFWKGGRFPDRNGYIYIWNPKHPFCNNRGDVFEHRLIVEKYIGRYLTKTELVHHIDENVSNNSPENLFVFENKSAHFKFHLAIRYGDLKLNWLNSNII